MKTCPHCGAQISETAKFCSECGYSFSGTAQPAKAQTKNFGISFIVNILFLVFAVSLFGVLAEPVINGLVSANVYSLCDSTIINDTAMAAISILLVVLVVCTLIAAVVTTAVKYVAYKDGKPVNGKTDWISFACYMLYLFVGIIMLVVVATKEHVLMGSCPIWLIVLSIIFLCLFACLSGACRAYVNYSVTAPETTAERHEQSPSATQSDNMSHDEATVNKKANSKKRKAILPEVFLLVFAVIMVFLYGLSSIMYINDYDYFFVVHINFYRFNFASIGSGTKTVINIIQIAFCVYLAIVAVTAIILLVKGCRRNSRNNHENVKSSKTLLISLIMQIIYILLVAALVIIAIMSIDLEVDIGSYFLAGVSVAFAIGTIIAMVKTKKKRDKQAAENLE